ncbi:MAG: ABC transporter substrate-binding protein, partial [Pontixanthobacter sp.]
VASSFMAPTARAALTDLGIRVETIGIASSIADSKAQIADLAELASAPAKGATLIETIDKAVSNARPSDDVKVPTVLWQPAGIVAGDNALVSELMRVAGFASHSAAIGLEQADYLSLEHMLSEPPQMLLLAGREPGQRHPALQQMAQRGDLAIASFDPSHLYCGGPTIIRALDRLSGIRDTV